MLYDSNGISLQVSLVSKDSSMLDGLDNASIEMDEAKVLCFPVISLCSA